MNVTFNSQLFNQWLKDLKLDEVSEKTINWYAYGIRRFDNYSDKPYNLVTEDDIKNFLAHLKNNGYSISTQKGNYTTLKIFFGYLVNKKFIKESPFKNFKSPRFKLKQISSFNKNEVEEILNSFDWKNFIEFRDYAILCTLFSTGLRKSELLSMTVSDAILNGIGYIKILGKGTKERSVPVGKALTRVLKKYNKRRRKFLAAKGKSSPNALWINNRGEPLTASGVDGIFDRLKQLDYPWSTRVSAHTVRHTFAVMFLTNGGDVFTLQKILGHSDISTTKIYIDLRMDFIKRQGDIYNPLDNTSWKNI